jgi:hypothetical protein
VKSEKNEVSLVTPLDRDALDLLAREGRCATRLVAIWQRVEEGLIMVQFARPSRMLKNATEGIDMAMGTDSLGQHARLG